MTPAELRDLITSGDIALPFEIATAAGKVYRVEDVRNVFAPSAFPDLVIVAMPGRGSRWCGPARSPASRARSTRARRSEARGNPGACAPPSDGTCSRLHRPKPAYTDCPH